VPEGLLLVVWSSIGLWVVGWVVLRVHSFYFVMGWVGLGQSFGGLGWVEKIGPTNNTGPGERRSKRNADALPGHDRTGHRAQT